MCCQFTICSRLVVTSVMFFYRLLSILFIIIMSYNNLLIARLVAFRLSLIICRILQLGLFCSEKRMHHQLICLLPFIIYSGPIYPGYAPNITIRHLPEVMAHVAVMLGTSCSSALLRVRSLTVSSSPLRMTFNTYVPDCDIYR